MHRRGFVLTIEGIPGSGKTTLAQSLEKRLRAAGVENVRRLVKDSGEKSVESLRRLSDSADLGPLAALLVVAALRAEQAEKIVRPALAAGGVLLLDTFAETTSAQAAAAGELPGALVESLVERAVGDAVPDLTFLLDGDAATLFARRRSGKKADEDEAAALERQGALRFAFAALAAREPSRFFVLDAERPAEEIADRAWEVLAERLRLRGIALDEGAK